MGWFVKHSGYLLQQSSSCDSGYIDFFRKRTEPIRYRIMVFGPSLLATLARATSTQITIRVSISGSCDIRLYAEYSL